MSQADEYLPAMSATADAYLNRVLDILERNALHAKEVGWIGVRREMFKRAEGAQTTVDTYPAIYYALTQFNEHHSFLRLPDSLSDADKKRSYTAMNRILGPSGLQAPQLPKSPFRGR